MCSLTSSISVPQSVAVDSPSPVTLSAQMSSADTSENSKELTLKIPLHSIRSLFLHEENISDFLSVFKKKKEFSVLEDLTLSGLKNIQWMVELKALHLESLSLLDFNLKSWNILQLPSTRNIVRLILKTFTPPKTLDFNTVIFFPCLERLGICCSDIKNFADFRAWKAPHLKEISLSRHIDLEDFKGISGLTPKLERLIFRNIEIKSFKGLTHLSLPYLTYGEFHCVLSDTALEELKDLDLSHLKVLRLSISLSAQSKHGVLDESAGNKKITDLSYFPHFKLSHLVYLDLSSDFTSLRGLENFFLPKLRILDVRGASISQTEINRIQTMFGPTLIILQ